MIAPQGSEGFFERQRGAGDIGEFVGRCAGKPHGPRHYRSGCEPPDHSPVVLQPLEIAGPRITIPDRPGLGVEPDWDTIRDLRG